jgi:hypothetical protein
MRALSRLFFPYSPNCAAKNLQNIHNLAYEEDSNCPTL